MYVNPKFKVEDNKYFSSPTGCVLAYSVVYSSDPDRSIAFYCALFGFEVKLRHGKWWAELACGTTSLAIHWTGPAKDGAAADAAAPAKAPTGDHGPGSSAPSFFVPNLQEWHDRIKSTPHLTVIQPPKKQAWGGSQAVYADPDGLGFSVVEAPQHKAGGAEQH